MSEQEQKRWPRFPSHNVYFDCLVCRVHWFWSGRMERCPRCNCTTSDPDHSRGYGLSRVLNAGRTDAITMTLDDL